MVPNNLLIANLVFCYRIRASLSDFKPISHDLAKPLRALRFFILGAETGLYGGMGLFSKYRINCLTPIFWGLALVFSM